ncbi:ABC transporter substrate-binding protein [Clostridium thermarum]|uniref:ABC transporter substrate-binding protein n=1 Tax=Clostridium thermarum TaxID=1716543 RepID=UPI001122532D|nr:sugar ABC transporter substrate-binding protein [Clostridium thermarum]
MKKSLAFLLTAVTSVSLLFAGCGKGDKPADKTGNDSGDATPKVTTLNFWTFQELHKQFWDDAVITWNKNHPDKPIEVKTDVYPYDDMHNKLLIALQSGTGAPDIADIEISKFENYVKSSNPPLLELNDIVEPVKDNLVMGRLDTYAKNGKYYGVDYHAGAQVMYYNKEILEKAGVNVDDIKTWDDYMEAGKKVVAATGIPMATIETTDQWTFYPLINMQGSDYFDKDGKAQLDNQINIKTLQMLYDMVYKDKIAVLTPGGNHHAEEYWAWMNKGNAASLWMPLWYMSRFEQYMPDLKGKIVVRPMPSFPGGKKSAGMGGTATVIANQTKHEELAKQFMAEAKLSKEGSIKTWTVLGFDPIREDAWTDPAMEAPNKYTDYFGTDIFKTLQSIVGDISGLNLTENYPDATSLIQKNIMFKVLKEQSDTPEQALREATEELNNK